MNDLYSVAATCIGGAIGVWLLLLADNRRPLVRNFLAAAGLSIALTGCIVGLIFEGGAK